MISSDHAHIAEGEMKEAIRWYIEVGDHDRKDQ